MEASGILALVLELEAYSSGHCQQFQCYYGNLLYEQRFAEEVPGSVAVDLVQQLCKLALEVHHHVA